MSEKGRMINKEGYEVPTMSRKIAYGLGDVGCGIIWSLVSSFILLYYTDSVGLSAAFVGSMMLIARILDGGSDLLMGAIIEKTNTKLGKARPWFLIGTFPLVISFLMMFNVPTSFSMTYKCVYATATYIFLAVISYTMTNLAYHAILPRFSSSQNDRTLIRTITLILQAVSGIVTAVLIPIMLKSFGGEKEQRAWTAVAFIIGMVALVCLLICFFGAKEQVPKVPEGKVEKTPVKQTLKIILRTKYFYIALTSTLVSSISSACMQGGLSYYAKDVLGSLDYYTPMTLALGFVALPLIPFMPMVTKKFGRRNSVIIGQASCIVFGLLSFINPTNPTFAIVMLAVRMVGAVPLTTISFTLAADIVDYISWKDGVRAEGMITAVNSFGMKVGSGLGVAMLGWILALGQYNAKLEVQTSGTVTAIVFVTIGVPLICTVITFIAMYFWDIDKYRPEIEAAQKRA